MSWRSHTFFFSVYTSLCYFWLGLVASDHHDVYENIFILLHKITFFCGGRSSLTHSHPLFPDIVPPIVHGLSWFWAVLNPSFMPLISYHFIVCCFDPVLSPSSPLGVNGNVAVTTHCSRVIIIWFLSSVKSSLIIYCMPLPDVICSLSKVIPTHTNCARIGLYWVTGLHLALYCT